MSREAVLLDRRDSIRNLGNLLPLAERRKLSVVDLKVGSYFKIGDEIYEVVERNRFHEEWDNQSWDWYELEIFSLKTGQSSYLEWFKDNNELSLSFTPSTEPLSIQDINLTPSRLTAIGNDDDATGTVYYRGEAYRFNADGYVDADYYPGDAEKCEKVRMYTFLKGNKYVTVNRWFESTGRAHQVYVGYEISPSSIEVLTLTGKTADATAI